eukprot:12234819-Alexandrium_andersonii.AAC.1
MSHAVNAHSLALGVPNATAQRPGQQERQVLELRCRESPGMVRVRRPILSELLLDRGVLAMRQEHGPPA